MNATIDAITGGTEPTLERRFDWRGIAMLAGVLATAAIGVVSLAIGDI